MALSGLHALAIAAPAVLVPLCVQAEMYRCPPAPGSDAAVITNLIDAEDAKQRGCQPMKPRRSALDQPMREPVRTAAVRTRAPAQASAVPAGASAASAPAGERRVAPQVQRQRDDQRREILEAELRKELDAATQLKARLDRTGPEQPDRQQSIAALARHVANVDALKQEIARMP